jgi:hypothetical protein
MTNHDLRNAAQLAAFRLRNPAAWQRMVVTDPDADARADAAMAHPVARRALDLNVTTGLNLGCAWEQAQREVQP